MESCRLPIEVCEMIIDAICYRPRSDTLIIKLLQGRFLDRKTLYACALTCRAWRIRAQRRLRVDIYLSTSQDIALFTAALSIRPDWCMPNTAALNLFGPLSVGAIDLEPPPLNSLFMHSLPGLEKLSCTWVKFDLAPRVLRMRPPFFSCLEILELYGCMFHSLRGLLDVVWACPNLSSLSIRGCDLDLPETPISNPTRLSAICEHLRACERLTSLQLESTLITEIQDIEGKIFGSAISDLTIEFKEPGKAQSLTRFLHNSYPVLSKIHLIVDRDPSDMRSEARLPSVLATLSESLPRSEMLKVAILQGTSHCLASTRRGLNCVTHLVRKDYETMASGETSKTRLSGLENLTISLHPECVEKCAAYVDAALPSLRSVLRFRYPDYEFYGVRWVEYRVPRGESE